MSSELTLSRIAPRPSTPPPATVSPRAEVRTTAPVIASAANALQQSSFQGARAATQPTPGAWRGGPDTEVGKAIKTMLDRANQTQITIRGDTPASLLGRAILDNPRISNEQLMQMANVTLEQLSDSPEDRQVVLKKIPNARELDVHKFTVAMLAAATGLDPKELSHVCPDLGMTGAPGTPLLYAPKTERMKRSTALHDFTDYLRGAGLKGLNKAVWGVEDRILSAAVSALGGGRY